MQALIILQRQPLREQDWLLDVFSRQRGRLSLVLNRPRLAPDLFTLYQGDWQPVQDWPALKGWQQQQCWPLQDTALFCGFYLNELLVKLLPRYEALPALFDAYQAALNGLHSSPVADPWLRLFEVQLLAQLGYGFSWQQDALGAADTRAVLLSVYSRPGVLSRRLLGWPAMNCWPLPPAAANCRFGVWRATCCVRPLIICCSSHCSAANYYCRPWGWLTNSGDDRDRETSVKNPQRVLLGVNIDHVATLRQARGTIYPDPVQAAFLAEEAGADGITVHPREDRRHIQTRDVLVLAKTLSTKMNLEMAVTDAMLTLAEEVRPAASCLVPEKREELTTEGGLDVVGQEAHIRGAGAAVCRPLAAKYRSLLTRILPRSTPLSAPARRSLNCTPAATPMPPPKPNSRRNCSAFSRPRPMPMSVA